MQQRAMDRWIEAAEARRICVLAVSERAPAALAIFPAERSSLLAKLRSSLMLDPARRLPAFATIRRAA